MDRPSQAMEEEYYTADRDAPDFLSHSHAVTVSHHTSTGSIPRQTRPPHQSSSTRRRYIDPSLHLQTQNDDQDHVQVTPASPEVISSLITSLSIISQPASKHFDDPSLSISNPVSPADGSFGVDYGTYFHALGRLQEEDDLNIAASPPVIRTAKPPSGFSPITAPKSPRREASHGLKSLLRYPSRPSSNGSASSSHDDTPTIGNLSIERGLSAPPDMRKSPSQESWGAKLGRTHKGLMYMSSRERLRAGEGDKKRNGGAGLGLPSRSSSFGTSMNTDQVLAQSVINEEPTMSDFDMIPSDHIPPADTVHVLHPIPLRDSSLRGAHNTKRPSRRTSNQRSEDKRAEYNPKDSFVSDAGARPSYRTTSGVETSMREEDIFRDMIELPRESRTSAGASPDHSFFEQPGAGQPLEASVIDDGAPSPAIYQSRRQSSQSADRRKSGRATPDPADMLKPKRSSSRLNRLSTGPKSPGFTNTKDGTTSDPLVGYERPGSADSVDDAVEAYLRSPRLTQKIRHPQTGRVISFSEVGDIDGSAVFCCVGMGLTRYITAFYDELAVVLKLRLITPDRPGVGDSEAYDGTTTPLSWPDDVYAICQALKITKFSILAHSAGAIYALATALRMPQHIRGRIHLLAPWIPPSQMNVFGTTQALPPTNAIPTSQKILRALPTPFLKAANSSFMSATSSSITSSLPKGGGRRNKRKSAATQARDNGTTKHDVASGMDKENILDQNDTNKYSSGDVLSDKPHGGGHHMNAEDAIAAAAAAAEADKERQMTYDLRLTHAIWDLATTGANPAVDLLVCLERRHTIGFRYVDITRPVVIHHGSKDTRVPVDNVRWLGKAMRRCEVRVLEDEGHGLMASASVMGTVLMEISKEWEDWTRLTNPARNEERGRSTLAAAAR